jgi:hypothetical protein
MTDENSFNYLTREHEHKNGEVGRDLYSTPCPATLVNDEARKTGLPRAQDIGTKTQGKDY